MANERLLIQRMAIECTTNETMVERTVMQYMRHASMLIACTVTDCTVIQHMATET